MPAAASRPGSARPPSSEKEAGFSRNNFSRIEVLINILSIVVLNLVWHHLGGDWKLGMQSVKDVSHHFIDEHARPIDEVAEVDL